MVNVASATCIVFANKTLFTHFGFHFVYALTLVHVITTLAGMHLFAAMGLYERKRLPITPLLSLATAFVGYIVFWNISLQVQPSPHHQVMFVGQLMVSPSEDYYHETIPCNANADCKLICCSMQCRGVQSHSCNESA